MVNRRKGGAAGVVFSEHNVNPTAMVPAKTISSSFEDNSITIFSWLFLRNGWKVQLSSRIFGLNLQKLQMMIVGMSTTLFSRWWFENDLLVLV